MRSAIALTLATAFIGSSEMMTANAFKNKNKEVPKKIDEVLPTSNSVKAGQDRNCNANPHLVTSLPYFNESQQLPCMYAGTFNVSLDNTTDDHNLFYWFFKNTSLTTPQPLVIWINGGPGSSSMFGLFLENGPLRVSQTGPTNDDYIVNLSPDGSWGDIADIVFIDQPVGTGFSYGNYYLDRMDYGAKEFVNFLRLFMYQYPEYQQSAVYLAGESYAGKYLPHFTYFINRFNERQENNVPANERIQINLHATLIGDPFVSPIRQRTSTHLVAKGENIYDSSNLDQVAALRKKCFNDISTDWLLGTDNCGMTMDYIDDIAGGLFTYDGTIFDYDWNPIEDVTYNYLTVSGKVQDIYKAIHIDQSTKTPVFEPSSGRVADNYTFEEMMDWSVWYDRSLNRDQKLLIYAGEYD